MTDGPTLTFPPDRRCPQAPRHRWERAPEHDIELGPAYRCLHCPMVRWAEYTQRREEPT